MSTKQNPGQFDCYAKLKDDEPYFVLRAKDPCAPALVEEWVTRRSRMHGQENNPKFPEALACADAMRAWRATNYNARACGCDPATPHRCDQFPDCQYGRELHGPTERITPAGKKGKR